MSIATSPFTFDTLDGQVNGFADQLSRLNEEVSDLRRRDAVATLAMQRVNEEQRLAARLQQDFLPKQLPDSGPVMFHTIYKPAGFVSGDLYDVMRLDEQHVGFYIADAVGHGMPAALLTMFMKNALVTKEIGSGSYRLLEPHQTIARLNVSLCDQHLSHATFATAAYGTIDTRTLEFCFSTAGHPNPVLLRDGELKELKNDGALLGIFPDEMFQTCRIQLRQGDRVFCYTDGVETAFNDVAPDTEQWRTEILDRGNLPTDKLMGELLSRIDRPTEPAFPRDDLTIIAITID